MQSSARNLLTGRIRKVSSHGPYARVTVDAGIPLTALITVRSARDLSLAAGQEISLGFNAGSVHLIPVAGGAGHASPAPVSPRSPAG